jgi:hypothetical protein
MLPLTIVPLARSALSASGGDHPHHRSGILSQRTQETLRISGTHPGAAFTFQKRVDTSTYLDIFPIFCYGP